MINKKQLVRNLINIKIDCCIHLVLVVRFSPIFFMEKLNLVSKGQLREYLLQAKDMSSKIFKLNASLQFKPLESHFTTLKLNSILDWNFDCVEKCICKIWPYIFLKGRYIFEPSYYQTQLMVPSFRSSGETLSREQFEKRLAAVMEYLYPTFKPYVLASEGIHSTELLQQELALRERSNRLGILAVSAVHFGYFCNLLERVEVNYFVVISWVS